MTYKLTGGKPLEDFCKSKNISVAEYNKYVLPVLKKVQREEIRAVRKGVKVNNPTLHKKTNTLNESDITHTTHSIVDFKESDKAIKQKRYEEFEYNIAVTLVTKGKYGLTVKGYTNLIDFCKQAEIHIEYVFNYLVFYKCNDLVTALNYTINTTDLKEEHLKVTYKALGFSDIYYDYFKNTVQDIGIVALAIEETVKYIKSNSKPTIFKGATRQGVVKDGFGNTFRSFKELCEFHNIPHNTLISQKHELLKKYPDLDGETLTKQLILICKEYLNNKPHFAYNGKDHYGLSTFYYDNDIKGLQFTELFFNHFNAPLELLVEGDLTKLAEYKTVIEDNILYTDIEYNGLRDLINKLNKNQHNFILKKLINPSLSIQALLV